MKETEQRLERRSDINKKQYRLKGNYIKNLSELNRVMYPTILRIPKPVKKTFREITEQALLQKLAPVAVLVNATGNIQYIHGHTGLYLEMVTGFPGIINVIKMARKGLQKPLVSALHKAVSEHMTVTKLGNRVEINQDAIWVDLTVAPLDKDLNKGYNTTLYLIIMEKKEAVVAEKDKYNEIPTPKVDFSNQEKESFSDTLNIKKSELEEVSKALEINKVEMDASREALKRFNKYIDESKSELQTLSESIEIKRAEQNALLQAIDNAKAEIETINNHESETNHQEIFAVDSELADAKAELLSVSEALHLKKLEAEQINDELLGISEELSIKKLEIEQTKDDLSGASDELSLKKLEVEQVKDELLGSRGELNLTKLEVEQIKDELLEASEELSITKIEVKQIKDELIAVSDELNAKKIEIEKVKFELMVPDQEFRSEEPPSEVIHEKVVSTRKSELDLGLEQFQMNDPYADLQEPFSTIPNSQAADSENHQKFRFIDSRNLEQLGGEESNVLYKAEDSPLEQPTSEVLFKDVAAFNSAAILGFRHDSSIKSVRIPEGVERLKRSLFYKCEELETVVLPSTLKYIEDFAFYGCEKLTSISLENCIELESIGTSAFEGCTSLTTIRIPGSVVEIEAACFLGCKKLEVIKFSGNSRLEIIGSHGFKDCESIQNIELPDQLKQMGMSIFYGCRGLKSIALPNKLETIGEHAFWGCDSLREIFVPNRKLAKQPGLTSGLPKEIKLIF